MSNTEKVFNKSKNPVANLKSVIKGDKYRFTVITDRIIRIEYNKNGVFEDRATQTIVNRYFETPKYEIYEDIDVLIISTEYVKLTYVKGKEFSETSLRAKFKNIKNSAQSYASELNIWYYGQENTTLKGTVRTLDVVNGETELEEGLASAKRFTVLDDSNSLIIDKSGKVLPREADFIDIYLFGYATDYYGLLRDFYNISGYAPLLPRYAMGNMWSRYYKYTQQEYIDLMNRFEKEECPFSVAVIDMDWHLVDECDPRFGTGWTGYTWNKKLFPDYKKFLNDLHKKNLAVTLNLHPADGVAPHEVQYEKMAKAMGITDGSAVEFDITDPKFIKNYFEILHHPYEDEGVSFWWIDWQQGNTTKIENLDPLWMLNHFHSLDMEQRGKRPMILSRYAGIGSHRYPLGFSGDTYMTWESLRFQPYFTATASNVGYTWWSHDIGGHMGGIRDDELNVRWVQFGVFSPINRLHSTANPLLGKEPWNYNEIAEKSIKKFLRLRHELIPYLYTMNYRTAVNAEPLIASLYYRHPKSGPAYESKFQNEYYFGSEMLVAPITQKNDTCTGMAYVDAWLPEGIWYDFFNGRRYKGNKSLKVYRNLYEYPVFVKAGGIIPMSGDKVTNDVSNPECLKVKVFAGDNNSFELYEDDGLSIKYKSGEYSLTEFKLKHGKKPEFTVNRYKDDSDSIPENRRYEIEFIGYGECDDFTVTCNGKPIEYTYEYTDRKNILKVSANGEIKILFNKETDTVENDDYEYLIEFIRRFQGSNDLKHRFYDMLSNNVKPLNFVMYMNEDSVDENIRDVIMEILTAEN